MENTDYTFATHFCDSWSGTTTAPGGSNLICEWNGSNCVASTHSATNDCYWPEDIDTEWLVS